MSSRCLAPRTPRCFQTVVPTRVLAKSRRLSCRWPYNRALTYPRPLSPSPHHLSTPSPTQMSTDQRLATVRQPGNYCRPVPLFSASILMPSPAANPQNTLERPTGRERRAQGQSLRPHNSSLQGSTCPLHDPDKTTKTTCSSLRVAQGRLRVTRKTSSGLRVSSLRARVSSLRVQGQPWERPFSGFRVKSRDELVSSGYFLGPTLPQGMFYPGFLFTLKKP